MDHPGLFDSVGLDSEPQVVSVNDHPAILIGGATGYANLSGTIRTWNPERWRIAPKEMTLIWKTEEMAFRIFVVSKSITKAQLLRIAESIP